jgi:hypothetical protein
MKFILTILFSLLAIQFQFVAAVDSQEDHERENAVIRETRTKPTRRPNITTTILPPIGVPKVEKKYECIPYQDYVVRNSNNVQEQFLMI